MTDLTASDRCRLEELADHGPAIRNAGAGWKLAGQNRRADKMQKFVDMGFAQILGERRQAQVWITETGRAYLSKGGLR